MYLMQVSCDQCLLFAYRSLSNTTIHKAPSIDRSIRLHICAGWSESSLRKPHKLHFLTLLLVACFSKTDFFSHFFLIYFISFIYYYYYFIFLDNNIFLPSTPSRLFWETIIAKCFCFWQKKKRCLWKWQWGLLLNERVCSLWDQILSLRVHIGLFWRLWGTSSNLLSVKVVSPSSKMSTKSFRSIHLASPKNVVYVFVVLFVCLFFCLFFLFFFVNVFVIFICQCFNTLTSN